MRLFPCFFDSKNVILLTKIPISWSANPPCEKNMAATHVQIFRAKFGKQPRTHVGRENNRRHSSRGTKKPIIVRANNLIWTKLRLFPQVVQARGASSEIWHPMVGCYKDLYGRLRSIAKLEFYWNIRAAISIPCFCVFLVTAAISALSSRAFHCIGSDKETHTEARYNRTGPLFRSSRTISKYGYNTPVNLSEKRLSTDVSNQIRVP